MKTEPLKLESPEKEGARATVRSLTEMVDRSLRVAEDARAGEASLLEICRAMGAGLNLQEVLNKILEVSIRRMRAQQGSILLFDEHQDRLQMLAAFGLPKEIVDKGYIPRKGSIAEWVIERAEPLILNERAQGREFNALDDKRKIVSSMCVPLQAPRGILGTINLNRTDPSISTFGQPELDAMTILASQASIYIEYSRLHEANLKSERLAAIGQTVAGISHCIKNLVTGMKGGVSLCKMARDHQDWEIHDQAMEVLGHSVKRVSDLVMDMLEYSKDREPDLGDVDLEALLLEIRGVTRAKAEKLKVEVEIKLSEEARRIRADGHKLFRCLLNLMENGLDAAGIDGRVTVSAERSRSESALKRLSTPARAAIVIRVADSGPGIDPEHRAQIFEPFFSTKGSKGTGLGLAVTQKIIREHGGELELESKPGGSAVFAIHLPAGDEISTNHSDE